LCPKCGNFKSYSNFSTHFKNCSTKNDKRIELINEQAAEIKNLKTKIMKLEFENSTLKNKINSLENNIDDKITFENLLILKKDNTRKLYTNVWDSYLTYCRDNQKNHENRNSAIEYFNNISKSKLKHSTQNTTRSVLIRLFKSLFNKDLSLLRKHKFRNLKLKPKYNLSNEQIKEFLKIYLTEEHYNLEVFLSLYILTFSSCRCHSLAMLKKENYINGEFHMYDSKTENTFIFKMSGRVLELVEEYLSMHTDTYLFFSQNILNSTEEDELVRIRGKYVSNKIINLIKKSKFFNNDDAKKYCLSSHMWRRTKASISHKEAFEFACKVSRESIGQAVNSSANLYYVPGIETYENKEYTKLKSEIDELISDYLNHRSQKIFETDIDLYSNNI
jgi:hypothetical protein